MNRYIVKMKYITLSGTDDSKQQFPLIGLGTWQASSKEMEEAVSTALELGYRHIDTAFNYNNEEAIGNALRQWFDSGKGKREELFITTKLPHIGNRPKDVKRFLNMSLKRLQLDYVDLYLIHLPFGFQCDESTLTPATHSTGEFKLDMSTDHISTWKVLEEQVRDGLVKNIGLSNFNENQIRRVYENSTIKPVNLQVELHAYMQQKELRNVCKNLGITITAYSPLGSPNAKTHFKNKYNYQVENFPDILGHPIVKEIAQKYNKSEGQILLRHLIQNNIVVIPKSANPKRIKDNINIFDFELTTEDMKKMDSLDLGEDGRIFNFLFFKGVENHPEYPFQRPSNRGCSESNEGHTNQKNCSRL